MQLDVRSGRDDIRLDRLLAHRDVLCGKLCVSLIHTIKCVEHVRIEVRLGDRVRATWDGEQRDLAVLYELLGDESPRIVGKLAIDGELGLIVLGKRSIACAVDVRVLIYSKVVALGVGHRKLELLGLDVVLQRHLDLKHRAFGEQVVSRSNRLNKAVLRRLGTHQRNESGIFAGSSSVSRLLGNDSVRDLGPGTVLFLVLDFELRARQRSESALVLLLEDDAAEQPVVLGGDREPVD